MFQSGRLCWAFQPRLSARVVDLHSSKNRGQGSATGQLQIGLHFCQYVTACPSNRSCAEEYVTGSGGQYVTGVSTLAAGCFY